MAAVAVGLLGFAEIQAAAADTKCYELRIYHTAPGKLDDLHQRFRNHTLRLFEKHGIRSVGYWVPLQNNEDTRLFFLLSYPSRAAREQSWSNFVADPDWQAAHKASEANGPLVQKAENFFLSATDYSPAIKTGISKERRVFEFRDYTASAGNLSHLNARFRDHTVKLFAKHGIHNYGYWTPMAGEAGSDSRLVYLVTHASTDAAKASFAAFGQDPKWKAAREGSEKNAGGSLTAPGGVKSTFLIATDYSPTR
ncbi:MAG: NIPSNAP family protein [Verrucomicrobiales bacterium]|nr:NIPSNAP family protein [Verrucomicrobiales bacterium]